MSSVSPEEVVNSLTATVDVNENNPVSFEQSEVSQNDQIAERSEEKSSSGRYDLIVDGTGLTASIVACAASRSGKTVLHIDSNDYYGCNSASFPLEDFLTWCRASFCQETLHSDEKEEFVDEEERSPIGDTKSESAQHHSETSLQISNTSALQVLLSPTPSLIRVIQFQDISKSSLPPILLFRSVRSHCIDVLTS